MTKVTYDRSADAVYVALSETSGDSGRFGFTYACNPAEVGGLINLDFDNQGRLIGIEVLDASKLLLGDVLQSATKIGR